MIMLPVINLQNSYAVENISGNIKSLLQPPRTRTEFHNNWINYRASRIKARDNKTI